MRQRYPGSAFTLGDSPTGLYSAHPGWCWPAAKRMSCPRRWQRCRSSVAGAKHCRFALGDGVTMQVGIERRLARRSPSVHQALSEIDSERMADDGRAARPAEARYPLHRYKAGTTKALTAELEVLGPRRRGDMEMCSGSNRRAERELGATNLAMAAAGHPPLAIPYRDASA
jgi:hypothetical protein